MNPSVVDVTFVGLIMVFSIFAILYFLFYAMSFVTRLSKFARRKKVKIKVVSERVVARDEQIVAAIMGALSMTMSKPFRIISIRKAGKRGWSIWRKKGWKGVGKWSGDIE